jgi:predicted Fe-Mo cluster-binding NifX family protein
MQYSQPMEKKTNIAIALFNNRVSPRFEFAPTLLVATTENNLVLERREIDLKSYDLFQRSALMREVGIDILICGGIQGFITRSLSLTNVQVIAPVAGEVSEVLKRFLEGTLCSSFKPCCAAQRCQRRNREMFGIRRKKEEKNFGEKE